MHGSLGSKLKNELPMVSFTPNELNERYRRRSMHRASRACLPLLLALVISPVADCQVGLDVNQGAIQSTGEGGNSTADTLNALGSAGSSLAGDDGSAVTSSQGALSAMQIIGVLQQSPELQTELKNQLAERLQQQGIQIDANDISDQTLYNQINSNASLRSSITTVLRSRGEISAEELPSLSAGGSGEPASLSLGDGSSQLDAAQDGLGRASTERTPGVEINPNSG